MPLGAQEVEVEVVKSSYRLQSAVLVLREDTDIRKRVAVMELLIVAADKDWEMADEMVKAAVGRLIHLGMLPAEESEGVTVLETVAVDSLAVEKQLDTWERQLGADWAPAIGLQMNRLEMALVGWGFWTLVWTEALVSDTHCPLLWALDGHYCLS